MRGPAKKLCRAAASAGLPLRLSLLLSLLLSLMALGAGRVQAASDTPLPDEPAPAVSPQARQCLADGWQRVVTTVDGLPRQLLWKGPPGAWTRGAVLVLHGGGGSYTHGCVANLPIIAPQVRFSALALDQGFAVVLLDSSDRVSDREGRACGKVWDDEVRERPNLDLPFIETVVRDLLPAWRPAGSRPEVFVTGLSSGGYMSTRAATRLGDRITAFAPVSSGDPYGWHRVCEAGLNARRLVHGAGFDNETGRQIVEPGACDAADYPNERPWDGSASTRKPAFRLFRHAQDGINDASCGDKLGRQLRARGYPGEPDFVLEGGRRSLAHHLWQDDYNRPILAFFARQLGDTGGRHR